MGRLALCANSWKKSLYVVRETYILQLALQNRPFSDCVLIQSIREINASR